MARTAPRSILVVVAACWLVAGPGGLVLRAAVACRHPSEAAHHHHAGHHARMPGDGPCFCSQMVGAFDQAGSVAVPAVEPAQPARAPVGTFADRGPVSLPTSASPLVETPPPIVA